MEDRCPLSPALDEPPKCKCSRPDLMEGGRCPASNVNDQLPSNPALDGPLNAKFSGPDLMNGGSCPTSDVNNSGGSKGGAVKWNSYGNGKPALYGYSRTGRLRFVTKGVMVDRLPSSPLIHQCQCLNACSCPNRPFSLGGSSTCFLEMTS